MIEKNILQDKEEWLKTRKETIGGSDASCIVGMNPYKNNVQLWEEKKGYLTQENISSKDCVQYGIKAEPFLRELFKLDFPQYKVEYEDNNLFTNSLYPFAHASLDGWLINQDGRKGILEIKTTKIINPLQWAKWSNRIPQNYYIQCLHYLLVTEFDFVILKAQIKFSKDSITQLSTRHYFIERKDVEEDIKYLKEKEQQFYDCLKNDIRPNLILHKF